MIKKIFGKKKTGRYGPPPPDLTEDQVRTLESLEKIDNYPLYVLVYHGGYGFPDYLQKGVGHSYPLRTCIGSDLNPGNEEKAINKKGVGDPNIVDLRRPPGDNETGWKCSSFISFGAQKAVFGHNFDWYNRDSLLLFTTPPDGYASVSMVDMFYCFKRRQPVLTTPEDRENLLNAPYYPFDGMNEKGVAIGLMSVPHAVPPGDPAKVTIGDLSILRLVLDHAATVPEALELIGRYNVRFYQVPLHYLVADRSGRSVIVEYYRGQLKTFPGDGAHQVCTNFILAEAGRELNGRCQRYDLASRLLRKAGGSLSPKQGMKILEKISQPHTLWSIVYDLHTGQVAVTMGRKYHTLHRFRLPLTPWNPREPLS